MKMDPAFWRDLASQFRVLPDRTLDFRAIRDEGRWMLAGGAKSEPERARLRYRFEQLAVQAAAAAGRSALLESWLDLLVAEGPPVSGIETADDFGGQVVYGESVLIPRLVVASVDLCLKLETQAFIARLPAPPAPSPPSIPPSAIHAETIPEQLSRLRDESRWTMDELAEEIQVDPRTVQRHLAGDSSPYKRHIAAYERVFSKRLSRKVLIEEMP
jgi:hypothetical protein